MWQLCLPPTIASTTSQVVMQQTRGEYPLVTNELQEKFAITEIDGESKPIHVFITALILLHIVN